MGIFNDPWERAGVWLVVLARARAGAAHGVFVSRGLGVNLQTV